MRRSVRHAAMKKLLPSGVHIEGTKSHIKNAIIYASGLIENKTPNELVDHLSVGADLDPSTMSKQPVKTKADLEWTIRHAATLDSVDAAMSFIQENHPTFHLLNYAKILQAMRRAFPLQAMRKTGGWTPYAKKLWADRDPTRTWWLWGPTNLGKSCFVTSFMPDPCLPIKSNLRGMEQFIPGRHKSIVFDDVEWRKTSFEEMKKLMEVGTPAVMDARYTDVDVPADVQRVVTSQHSLQSIVRHMEGVTEADWSAIARRVQVVYVNQPLYETCPQSSADAALRYWSTWQAEHPWDGSWGQPPLEVDSCEVDAEVARNGYQQPQTVDGQYVGRRLKRKGDGLELGGQQNLRPMEGLPKKRKKWNNIL